MESMLLIGTTDANGALTITQKMYHPRRLVSVKWLAGNFTDGVDATLVNLGIPGAENTLGLSPGALNTTVLTLTDVNDDATYAANAIIDDELRLVVANGGAGKTGGCIAYFDETAVAAGGGDASAAKQDTEITALATLLTTSDFDTKVGSLTETAPATDTASSGLNGRLQRIAQNITSLIAKLPAALTTLGNFKVSIQEQIIRTYTKTSGTTATSGDQTLIAAPSAGFHLVVKDMILQNESAVETTDIVKNGATAEWRAKLAANAAFSLSFAEGEEWRLTTATALVLNLSGTNSHGYSIRYRTEAD